MDIKTIIASAGAALLVGVMLIMFAGIGEDGRDGADGRNGRDGVGVPGVNLIPSQGDIRTITPTTDITLTHSDSGSLYLIATGTTATLPAARDGVWFRFMVKGAIADTNFIASSTEGTNIEGALIVAGAVVDCDNETFVNIVADGENIGDFFELYSDGTNWLIGASGALTAAKLTCST